MGGGEKVGIPYTLPTIYYNILHHTFIPYVFTYYKNIIRYGYINKVLTYCLPNERNKNKQSNIYFEQIKI